METIVRYIFTLKWCFKVSLANGASALSSHGYLHFSTPLQPHSNIHELCNHDTDNATFASHRLLPLDEPLFLTV
jgi:hypothetical protein